MVKDPPKEKISVSIDKEIVDIIDELVREESELLYEVTHDKRKEGRSTIINEIMRAILLPEHKFDDLRRLDGDGAIGHNNFMVTLKHLLYETLRDEVDKRL